MSRRYVQPIAAFLLYYSLGMVNGFWLRGSSAEPFVQFGALCAIPISAVVLAVCRGQTSRRRSG